MLERLAPRRLTADIAAVRVHWECGCGCASVSFTPELEPHFPLNELEGLDSDYAVIGVVLFGDRHGSSLRELEVMRWDEQPIDTLPAPGTLKRPDDARWPHSDPNSPGGHMIWSRPDHR